MRSIIVCGGRAYHNKKRVFDTLDKVCKALEFDTLVEGGASGADALGKLWAQSAAKFVKHIQVPAEWSKHGKRAGMLRNQRMLELAKPMLVVAFPGGRGTADMVRRSRAAGVRVYEVAP